MKKIYFLAIHYSLLITYQLNATEDIKQIFLQMLIYQLFNTAVTIIWLVHLLI